MDTIICRVCGQPVKQNQPYIEVKTNGEIQERTGSPEVTLDSIHLSHLFPV